MDESPVSVSTSRLRPSESPMRDSSIMNTNNEANNKDNNNDSSSAESTAEERLRALQARTEQWKVTVAAQLKDAARKNKLLREELSAARTQREADLAALRLELHNEFKERTRLQTESITALNERIAELQKEQVALQEAHSAATAALEQRVRSECATEAAQQVSVAVAAERQRMAEVTSECAAMERRAGEALQAERQRCAERDAMTERYKELVSLFASAEEDKDVANSAGNDMSDVAHRESDTSSSDEGSISASVHAHHLATLRARLTGQSAKLHEQLTTASQEWQSERQRLMHEVHARDEQLVVVQTLLQQAQTERRSYEQRMQDAQLYRQEVEQSVRARVTSLERQLSALQEQLHDAEQNSTALQRRLQEEQERVRGLVEEAQAREEAITALVQSEGNKAVVYNLERALRATREELEQYKLRCAASEAHTNSEGLTNSTTQETSALSHSSPLINSATNNTHGSVNEKTTTGSSAAAPGALIVEGIVEGENNASGTTPLHVLHDERAAELTAREARLASREAQLASKEALLHSVEAKLEETKRSLAAHVSTLQRSGQISSPPRTHGISGANASDDDTTRIVVNDAEDEVVGRARPSLSSAVSHRTRGKTLYTLLKHVSSQVLRRRPWRWPMRSAGFSSYAAGTATTSSSTTPSANVFGRHELHTRLSGSLRSIVATRSRLLLAAMAALIVFVFLMNAWQAQAYNQAVQSTPTVVQPVQA